MDYTAVNLQAEQDRVAAFVSANKAAKCRREDCKVTGNLDKRGLCPTHAALRLATMRVDERTPEAIQRNENAMQTNARLKRAAAARDALAPALTINALLSGPSGQPQVTGGDLVRCTAAMSARVNFGDSLKKLISAETALLSFPNSSAAQSVYDRLYDNVEAMALDIKTAEALLKRSYPDLHCAPIKYPVRLERAELREWLEV